MIKLILISLAFSAGNWFPVGKQDANTIYRDKSKCEQVEQAPKLQECLEHVVKWAMKQDLELEEL